MKIREFMSQPVETCKPATDLAAVAMTMWRQDCGIVPVVDDQRRVLGVVTDRDICMAVATRHRRPEELTAHEVMSGEVFAVHPEDDARAALETMRAQRVRRLPVVDKDHRLQGIVSINDVLLLARPSGTRASTDLTANEVLAALQGICAHPLPQKVETPRVELATTHA